MTGDPPLPPMFPPLQWPYEPITRTVGWLCVRCNASLSPSVTTCPNCPPMMPFPVGPTSTDVPPKGGSVE